MGLKPSFDTQTPTTGAGCTDKYINTAYDEVKIVSDNIEDVNVVADAIGSGELGSVVDAAERAEQAAVNAEASEVSAAESAESAAEAFNELDAKYLGSFSVAPTTDNAGNPLKEGATYWDTTTNLLYYWTGSYWSENTQKFNQLATDFIANHTKPSGYTAGEIVEFIGWSTSGDGGAAQWVATGNQIAASQTPKDTANGTLSDSSGNEFIPSARNEWLNVEIFGVTADGTGANSDAINGAYNVTKYLYITSGKVKLDKKITIPDGGMFYSRNLCSTLSVDNSAVLNDDNQAVFHVDFGQDSANYYDDAAIELSNQCSIVGIGFWYPSQPMNVASPSFTYPPAIVTAQGTRGNVISNVQLGNAYIGIDSRRDQSGLTIDNIRGYPLRFGIRIGSSTDKSNITNVNLSPVQVYTGTPWVSPNLTSWVATNGVMVEIGRQTWTTFDKIWGIAYLGGINLINQTANPGEGINTGGSAQNCNIVNSGFDSVERGIYGDGFQGRLNIDNCNFAPKNFNDNPLGDTYAIDLDNDTGSVTNVNISNINVWAVAQSAIRLRKQSKSKLSSVNISTIGNLVAGDAILLDASTNVKISGVDIDGQTATTSNGIRCINNCDRVKISKANIENTTGKVISIDQTDNAVITDVSGSGNSDQLVDDVSATKKYNNVIKDCRDESDPNYTDADVSSGVLTVRNGRSDISYSGTTAISGIGHGYRGEVITLRFSAVATVTDNDAGQPQENRLYLAGNLTSAFGTTLTLASYGSLGWYEVSRSVN